MSDEWPHHKSDNLDVFVEQQAAEIHRLRAENEKLRAALKPFADVAENDIGDDEADADMFRPMLSHRRAPRLDVGHLRAAAAALKETGDE